VYTISFGNRVTHKISEDHFVGGVCWGGGSPPPLGKERIDGGWVGSGRVGSGRGAQFFLQRNGLLRFVDHIQTASPVSDFTVHCGNLRIVPLYPYLKYEYCEVSVLKYGLYGKGRSYFKIEQIVRQVQHSLIFLPRRPRRKLPLP